ncbi:histidine kinase dimerization/phosphoacceptor domain -containing protein [Methanobacterium petrolearium]|uniref:histidine kinase dimerization/phosphoacceptor domain -containing protein n=1 Tax=Methanobacterium petrolearium TaxID=710190 RepID=UPI001AE43A2B|nr:histidine kinase dimerization/phosphoacceptor domain -containing protein [Methanobacterium petrolearium]MBP1946274.1 two-component sensor histidine kinase [Methanobacterium petrolearium]BDZ71367.1 hypothetical protein GCM10025861_18840 [Methanobacterium petrolearium]
MAKNKTVLDDNLNRIEELEEKNRKITGEIALKNQIFSISPDYLFLLGLDGKIIDVSRQVKKLLKPDIEAVNCKLSQLNIIHIKDLHKFIKSTNSILNGGEIKPFPSIFLAPDSESIPVNVQISPVKSDDEIVAILVYATDITSDVLLEKLVQESNLLHKAVVDKEMLVREIHHRTKNNLMIMASLFSLTSADVEDEDARSIFTQAHSRVKSMALIHEKLYRSSDLKYINFGDYIRNLAGDLFNSFLTESENLELIMEVEDLKMDINTAIPVGLILNELLTNCIKYAFPHKEPGKIHLTFYKNTNHYVMTVADDGIGLPCDLDIDHCDSLGLQLVKNLIDQIQGEMIVNLDSGTEITIFFHEYDNSTS